MNLHSGKESENTSLEDVTSEPFSMSKQERKVKRGKFLLCLDDKRYTFYMPFGVFSVDFESVRQIIHRQIKETHSHYSRCELEVWDSDFEEFVILRENVIIQNLARIRPYQSIQNQISKRPKISNQVDTIEPIVSSVQSTNCSIQCNLKEQVPLSTVAIQTDVEDDSCQILHLIDNPFKWSCEKMRDKMEKLKEENKKLKVRLEMFKQGSAEVTRHLDDEVNKNELIEQLNQELAEAKFNQQSLLEGYKKTSKEFREVVYLLTGYRVDALKEKVYKLSHKYAGHNDELLFIEKDNGIDMLETPFSEQFIDLIEKYLVKYNSFPIFLASITQRLFEKKQSA